MVDDRLDLLKKTHGFHSDSVLDVEKTSSFKQNISKELSKIKRNLRVKLKSITLITVLIALVFFSINLFSSSLDAIARTTPLSSSLSQKLNRIIVSLKNGDNLESVYKDFETNLKDFQKELSNLNHKFWPLLNFDDLTKESWDLTQLWINSISNLAQFRLGAEGFVSDLNKNFTQYLEDFFEELPLLINKTRNFFYKINSYVSWAYWLPNGNIKKIQSLISLGFDSLDILDEIYNYRSGILTLLGYKKPHKILIFNQNIGESRPTGGFIGSYLPINITQGRFDIGKSESIYNIDDTLTKNMISFPASWYYDLQYGRYDTHGVRNLNYFSCFQDSASLIENEFNLSSNGQNSDTVIFLTPNLIQNLFTAQTELKIDLNQYRSGSNKTNKKEEVTITRDNFYEIIEKITALEYDDPNNPKSAITPILLAIVNNLDKVLAKQNQFELVTQWLRSGFTRDVQIWSKDNALEDFWDLFNFSGNQTCFDSDKNSKCNNWWIKIYSQECKNYEYTPVLAFLQANISSDKRDIFAAHDFEINVTRKNNENLVELNYKRSYKNLENLQRKFNARNGVTFIGFQLPQDAWAYSIDSEQSFETPFERPFYLLKIQEIKQKEIYTPKSIQDVINSSRDISSKSFIYKQPDQSLVIGTYINEASDVSSVELKFKTKNTNILFYPTPANSNNTVSVDSNSELIDVLNQVSNTDRLVKSKGQGLIVRRKN